MPVPHVTTDPELLNDPTYKVILKIVKELWEKEIIQRGQGYCVSMSDMIKTLLSVEGIDSRLVECKLALVSKSPPGIALVGYDYKNTPGTVDTHVVCITETDRPILIDLSIGNLTGGALNYIIDWADSQNQDNRLGEYNIANTTWVYTVKENKRLPEITEKNTVDRILADRRLRKEISWLRWLIIAALTVSVVNAVRGGYDFYTTYLDTGNYWGPTHIKQLDQRLDQIERNLTLPPEKRKFSEQEVKD